MQPITVDLEDPGNPEAVALIDQLDAYLMSLYPDASNHLMSAAALRQHDAIFFVARLEGRPVGCAAFINRDDAYAEVKRVFVLPDARGAGVGRILMQELERRASAAGLAVVRLETGVAQPEALRLFERAGYQRRDAFGDYAPDPLSVFMEKRLE